LIGGRKTSFEAGFFPPVSPGPILNTA